MRGIASPINIVSPDVDFLVENGRCTDCMRANSVHDLPKILESLLGRVPRATTLDLSGHSTRGHHLLRLGGTVVDMLDLSIANAFRSLRWSQLLIALNVVAVRLLGCETAVTDSGQRTLRLLSNTLGLPVLGTRVPLIKSHYTAGGFDPAFSRILVDASSTDRSQLRLAYIHRARA